MFLLLCKTVYIKRRRDPVKGIKQEAALTRHAFGIPVSARHVERNHAARTCLDTSPIGSDVNRHMVHIARHEPADQSPELAGQNVGFAVHRAYDVAGL